MSRRDKPTVKSHKGPDWTRVTFYPDFPRFKMKKLDSDTLSLFQRRVYDIAGTTDEKITVYLNGTKVRVKNFKDYVDLYVKDARGDGKKKCFPNSWNTFQFMRMKS
jgi:DNA topoisomerase II